FAPHARVIHVDIDPSEIGKNVPAAVPIVGDARRVLDALAAELRESAERAGREPVSTDLGGWLAHIRDLQAEHEPRQAYRRRPATTPLAPHDVYEALDRSLQRHGNYRVV